MKLKMKSARHAKIKNIIETELIETQEELTDALRRAGIQVTQATVSRDIKDLMLIKIPANNGKSHYAFPPEKNTFFSEDRMIRMFKDSVISIDFSENIIVIKTLPGTANAVATTLDYANWSEIIGTVAGDDNILAVIKPKSMVNKIVQKMKMMIS